MEKLEPAYLTIDQVCDVLQISKSTIHKRLARREINRDCCRKMAGIWRFKRDLVYEGRVFEK